MPAPKARPATSLLIRAKVSANEWRQLTILAAEQGAAPTTLVGQAIRELLQRNGKPTEGSVKK